MNRKFIHIFAGLVFTVGVATFGVAANVQQHLVKKGDTLWGISREYQVPLKSLMQANSIDIRSKNYLRAGDRLLIPGGAQTVSGDASAEEVWYQVKAGDTLWEIARQHNMEPRDLQRLNGISSPRRLQIGTRIRIHHDGSLGFGDPLRVPLVVTSRYGYRSHPVTRRYQHHQGIDFRAATGTRVYASRAGKVIYAGRKGGYGKVIGIDHGDNFTTWYGHLSRIRVNAGQHVAKGRVIGLSGNTGVSTGPHLHFEIRYKGRSENPTNHLSIP